MYQAVIFDMNGVIVNDERIQQEAWRRLLAHHNIQVSEDDYSQFVFGRTEKDVLRWVFKEKLTAQQIEDYSNERVNIAIDIFRPIIQETPGCIEFIKNLKNISLKLGLATSSRKRYTHFILHELHLETTFDQVVTAEDINIGKPDPEMYLKTATLLSVDPKDCLVFEDTISGISSAKQAGMKVVGIATTHTKDVLKEADFIVDSFEGRGITDFMSSRTL